MKMYFLVFLMCASLDIVCLLPFPDCFDKRVDMLVIFDCQGEAQEQIRFIDDFKTYLYQRSRTDIIRITFFSVSLMNVQNYDRFHGDVCNISDFSSTILVSDLMEISKHVTVAPEADLFMSFIFMFNVSHIQFNQTLKIIKEYSEDERNKGKQYHRFFIIQSSETFPEIQIASIVFHYSHSFKNVEPYSISQKICLIACSKFSHKYKVSKYMTSFYYVNHTSSTSHNQAGQYCSNQNSYLLSLETIEEFNFITSLLVKNFTLTYSTNLSQLHLGLETRVHSYDLRRNSLKWSSGTDFDYFNGVTLQPEKHCYNMHLPTYTNGTPLVSADSQKFWDYLEIIKCDEILHNSIVICECQEVRSDETSLLALEFLKSSSDDEMYTLTYGFFLDSLVDFDEHFRFAHGCVINMTYPHGSLQNYLCSSTIEDECYNSNPYISVVIDWNYVMITNQKVDVSECINRGCLLNSEASYILEVIDQPLSHVLVNKTENYSGTNNTDIKNSYTNDTSTNLCKVQIVQNNFSLEPFQCISNETGSFFRCLKIKSYLYNTYCKDNSNLMKCENFTCPQYFFKCPNSFCILTSMISDGKRDCPFGEDEIQFDNHVCMGNIGYVVKDICVLTQDIFWYIYLTAHKYACNRRCPVDYECFSSRTKDRDANESIPFKLHAMEIKIQLHKISNAIVTPYMFILPKKVFVQFQGSNCNIQSFDNEFRFWNFTQLLILDLSYNGIVSSHDLQSLEYFTKLKMLNLSHNENLKLNETFTFPTSLEIIDLSYTKIQTLRRNVFEKLLKLRHLNLSYTKVSRFIDMGLPDYYKLYTLILEGVTIATIEPNFFKGMTIESGLWVKDFTLCCSVVLNTNISAEKCHVSGYSISSCNHLVGDILKRIAIWIVALFTIVGNGIVLVDRIGWNRDILKKAYDLFITGLAISDFIMGVYLIIIACADVYFKEIYALEDLTWRHSVLCRCAGFLSTLSSETSTFFICLITLDRFITIKYPFGEHRFNQKGQLLSFILVWLLGFLVALLPIAIPHWENYSSNGLCLAMPFSSEQYVGWELSFVIFVALNFVLFLIIALGQLAIFLNYSKINQSNSSMIRNSSRRRQDWNVAKKLAFVALTNFVCWFPVGILGFLSAYGHTFDLQIYAWIGVFVLPINSALNPIIYTLPAIYNRFTTSRVLISSDFCKDEIRMSTFKH